MAAIRPFREEVVDEEVGAADSTVEVPGLGPKAPGALGALGVLSTFPSAEARQAELTRLLWMRQELERAVAGSRYGIVSHKGRAHIQLYDQAGAPLAIPPDLVPWFAGPVEHGRYAFFTRNTKMGVGTWDLPAGAPHFGGACPAATAVQLIVPEDDRRRYAAAMLPPPGGRVGRAGFAVNKDTGICGVCYAGKGNYPSPHVQMRELVAFWWVQDLFKQDREDEFVATMVDAILAENQPLTPQGIRPFRIHSAGDFYAPAYFAAWVEIAKRLFKRDPSIRLWAPTRCWSHKGFDWGLLGEIPDVDGVPVLMVRPSAYHIGDAAPSALAPGAPLGTTAVFHDDNLGMSEEKERLAWRHQNAAGRAWLEEHFATVRAKARGAFKGRDAQRGDPRFLWLCQAYAVGSKGDDLAKSCAHATGPDGKIHCRACWTDPDLSVCYTVH